MRKISAVVFLVCGLTACRRNEQRAPAIGDAYAGPAVLTLRKDIPVQSPAVAAVHHGERLEIIQRRRRFLKVRTPAGAEGWCEDHLLLSSQEIANLKEVEKRARSLPSQGVASTYELLNVHTEPNRLSPSFLQIKESEKVDVIGHVSSPRTPPARPPLVPLRPKAQAAERKHEGPKAILPPMPSPPRPPANWLELSKTPPEVLEAIAADKAAQPVPTDDWSLVRNAKGESGWVLTRRLFMAIPDDVAQYAEGHRITSYFSLGDVNDAGQIKHNWLWTTIGGGTPSYDFDSFRVFIWSLRRHRYETAYIQRNVQGYFPVLRQEVKLSGDTYPGFSMCLDNKEGVRVRRSFAFIVNVVRFAGEEPCAAAGNLLAGSAVGSGLQIPPPGAPPADRSLSARLKALAKKWFSR